jgi:cytochrome c-type biogenesis protein CcmH
VCQGETIYDSPSEYADDMKSILKEQIDNGLTDGQINAFWVERYGERIITNPITNNTEILIVPISIVLIFISIFIRKLYVKK